MKIGDKIKLFRKEKGLTQVVLADKASISRSYLADIENNRYNPSLDVLNSIADALCISINVFFDEDEETKFDSLEKAQRIAKNNKIETIAAHFEGEEFTDSDVEDIQRFIEYVVAKRKNKI